MQLYEMLIVSITYYSKYSSEDIVYNVKVSLKDVKEAYPDENNRRDINLLKTLADFIRHAYYDIDTISNYLNNIIFDSSLCDIYRKYLPHEVTEVLNSGKIKGIYKEVKGDSVLYQVCYSIVENCLSSDEGIDKSKYSTDETVLEVCRRTGFSEGFAKRVTYEFVKDFHVVD